MGTHALVLFCKRNLNNKLVRYVLVYHQYDGYLSGVGLQLAKFLTSIDYIRNGFSLQDVDKLGRIANGMECMVAQYIALHKTQVGGFYIQPIEEPLIAEYVYTVIYDEMRQTTNVTVEYGSVKKEMTASEFFNYCTQPEEGDEEIEEAIE